MLSNLKSFMLKLGGVKCLKIEENVEGIAEIWRNDNFQRGVGLPALNSPEWLLKSEVKE